MLCDTSNDLRRERRLNLRVLLMALLGNLVAGRLSSTHRATLESCLQLILHSAASYRMECLSANGGLAGSLSCVALRLRIAVPGLGAHAAARVFHLEDVAVEISDPLPALDREL
jgi:hypothetical protein